MFRKTPNKYFYYQPWYEIYYCWIKINRHWNIHRCFTSYQSFKYINKIIFTDDSNNLLVVSENHRLTLIDLNTPVMMNEFFAVDIIARFYFLKSLKKYLISCIIVLFNSVVLFLIRKFDLTKLSSKNKEVNSLPSETKKISRIFSYF